jgi:integrase/recombinase XerD
MCQLINGIYREAGIKGATSHAGRRGFITALANAGIGVKVIMELAGHRQLGSGLIDHIQKMTVAAMQIADMKVCAHRS